MSPGILLTVVVLCLVLAYVNGFHDASNAVSTAIATRSLSESTALALAAVLNLLGAALMILMLSLTAGWALDLLGLAHMAEATAARPDLLGLAVLAMILATLGWEVLTWWFGMPSSTWHAFYGSVAGAYLGLGMAASMGRVASLVLVPILLGPVLAAALSYLVMRGLLALARTERVRGSHIHVAQTISAGALATGHGMSDVRLPMALVVLASAAAGQSATMPLMLGVPIALALAAGTLMGGHRIIRTIGRRMTDLSSVQGLAAESSAVIVIAALAFGVTAPVSTSHALASGVVGAGLARGPRHVKWPVVERILLTWLMTPVATGATAALGVLVATRLV